MDVAGQSLEQALQGRHSTWAPDPVAEEGLGFWSRLCGVV